MDGDAETADTELVARLAAGDTQALAALYDRYASLLLAVARRMLRDERQAEDMVHDVFVAAWQDAARFLPERASVRTWLCMRARSRCLDRLRARRRQVSAPLEPPEPAAYASEDPALRPDRALATAALTGLPPAQREVLELAYFEDLSATEIAERLGVPAGTIKSRVRLAMVALRRALGVDPIPGAPRTVCEPEPAR